MGKLLMTTALLGALGAAPASAANTALIMWNGADPGGFETASGTGTAALASQDFDGVTVTLSFVNRETNPNGLTEGNINIQNTTATVQTLHIIAGVNGLLGPSAAFNLSATILAALGSSDLAGSFFVDAGNVLNGTSEGVSGLDVGDFASGGLVGPQSFAFNGFGVDSVDGPYGLAESLTLTLQPGAIIGVQAISMDAVSQVPEPSTWAMGMAGFAFLAFFGMQRARKDRLASI